MATKEVGGEATSPSTYQGTPATLAAFTCEQQTPRAGERPDVHVAHTGSDVNGGWGPEYEVP